MQALQMAIEAAKEAPRRLRRGLDTSPSRGIRSRGEPYGAGGGAGAGLVAVGNAGGGAGAVLVAVGNAGTVQGGRGASGSGGRPSL